MFGTPRLYIPDHRENTVSHAGKKSQPDLPELAYCLSEHFPALSKGAPVHCRSERSEESVPKAVRACAQRRCRTDVSAHKTTTLYEDINSSTFPFCLCRWRQRLPWQRPSGDGRYAPAIRDIRSQWHHRGAYLYANVEICAADPWYTPSVASSGRISPLDSPTVSRCVTDREHDIFVYS